MTAMAAVEHVSNEELGFGGRGSARESVHRIKGGEGRNTNQAGLAAARRQSNHLTREV